MQEHERIVREGITLLNASSQSFAKSLLGQLDEKGSLSTRQWFFIGELADRIEAAQKIVAVQTETSTRKSAAEKIDLTKIVSMFETVSLKRPYFLVKRGDLVLHINRAGENSRYFGQLMVCTPGSFADRVWLGRIDNAGVFWPSMRPIPPFGVADIKAALHYFAADPMAAAKAYGIETGECCFCSIELTDERSVKAGYGPICAKKWGLPWGCEAVAA